jgi:hypothetical protein
MITKEQAMTAREFSFTNQRNGKPAKCRRTGKTQTWKTRPNDFKVPVKYGLYESGYITQETAADFSVIY